MFEAALNLSGAEQVCGSVHPVKCGGELIEAPDRARLDFTLSPEQGHLRERYTVIVHRLAYHAAGMDPVELSVRMERAPDRRVRRGRAHQY